MYVCVYMYCMIVQVCLFHKYKYVQMILTSVVFVYLLHTAVSKFFYLYLYF